MPGPGGAIVPFMLGSAAGGAVHRLYKWADSRYISSRPVDTLPATTSMKRARRYVKRRRPNKRRRGIIRRRLPRSITPLAKLIRVKAVHPFSFTTSTTASASNVAMFDFTDPFNNAGAEQPLGYDQWKGLYNKGYVVGLKVSIRLHNKGSTAIMFGMTPMPESQGTTGLTTLEHYMEMPGTVSRLLSPDVDHGILVKKIGTARHIHVRNLRDEDAFHVDLDNETAPSRNAYLMYWCHSIDKTTSNTAEGVATVEYLVRLYDPIVPARSTDT